MKKISMFIAVCLLLPLIVFANDKLMIDAVNELRNKVTKDNNTYQEEVEVVYETLKKNEPMEVTIPEMNIFSKDNDRFMSSYNLPTKEKLIGDNETCIDPENLGDYKVFVFISESVPEVTIRNYMKDALKFKDVLLVMRGVIGSADFIKPTQDFMTRMTCGKKLTELKPNDESCTVSRLDINPQLFKLFGVEKAPVVVFSKLTYYELQLRANLNQPLNDSEYYIIRGDTSLEYIFERFEKAGADVKPYLKVLQGSYGG